MKLLRKCLVASFSIGLMANAFSGTALQGLVFLDSNSNGIQENGEPGIEGVAVSDGASVVASGADGTYSLETSDSKPTVFISTPSGYVLPAKGRWFINVANPAQKLDFPLVKDPASQEDFSFIQVTDTHLQSSGADKPNGQFHYKYVSGSQTWKYFFDKAMPQILKTEPNASFIVDTGDLGLKETSSSPSSDAKLLREKVEDFRIPYFFVPGNHDGLETLEMSPSHYSFNHGKFHFVFLKRFPNVENTEMARQFEWLAKDLAFLPPKTPTIFFCHYYFGHESYGGIEKSMNRSPEFMKIIEACDAKAFIYGHIHQNRMEKINEMLQMSAPSFNFGGGWSQEFFGYPPSYRIVDIKGTEVAATAVKSIEAADNPIWILSPKDMTVVEGAMYPYFNSCSFWNGKVIAVYLDDDFSDISSMSCKIDDSDYKPMTYYAKIKGQQGEWSYNGDIRKDMGPGKHSLTLKAEGKNGKIYEKSISLFSDSSFLPEEWPELMQNTSFEEKSADGTAPAGWKVDGKTVFWDDKEAKSGTHSIRTQMERPWGSFYIMDDIPVEPEGIYNLSLIAKGKDVLKMSYAIFPGMSDAHVLRFPDGTYDWTKINTQFRIKPGVRKIGLCIGNFTPEKRDGGSGTLWIDDISLRRVK